MASRIGKGMIGVIAAGAVGFLAMGASAPVSISPQVRPAVIKAKVPAVETPSSAAIDGLRPGLWTLRMDEPGSATRRLCLDDAAKLVQVAHPGGACSRLIVASGPHAATVSYECPGAGWGRTSLTVDSDDVVRIDTQGIAGNAPFAFRAEARRQGECSR